LQSVIETGKGATLITAVVNRVDDRRKQLRPVILILFSRIDVRLTQIGDGLTPIAGPGKEPAHVARAQSGPQQILPGRALDMIGVAASGNDPG